MKRLAVDQGNADGSSDAQIQPAYVVDTRPLCQGMPFVLTDSAHPRQVLKNGSHFLVLDERGMIPACNTLGYGYYRYDTRHLSQWQILFNDTPLCLLSSNFGQGYAGELLYTNTHTEPIAQQKLIVRRRIVLADNLWESLLIENYGNQPAEIELAVITQSDFADMFEVRGLNRSERGTRMIPATNSDAREIFLAYKGKDGMLVETIVEFVNTNPVSVEDGRALFRIELPVREARELEFSITTRWNKNRISNGPKSFSFNQAFGAAEAQYKEFRSAATAVETDLELFDATLDQSYRDLFILQQPTPKGYGLSAGIPWYCAVFGRDSAIAALQTLPFLPELARNSIEVLAAYQGQKTDSFRAEHPGKIPHELRLGELARMSEIPHSPYYGTVDATQLWLILIGEYVQWTADIEFAKSIWPNVKLALQYLEQATSGNTGFITYQRTSPQGLENQGWKDSGDAITHVDGRLPDPPIAVCEAQGYLYLAWLSIARLSRLLGSEDLAETLEQKAIDLKVRFQNDFWMDEKQYVAIAIDGHSKQVEQIGSNAGHCLWCGILDQEKADAVAERLLSPDLYTGWGIRTLASSEVNFNPISYHNGSIWPHDNAMIAEGLRRLGRVKEAQSIAQSLFEVAKQQGNFRLPELFCGFDRSGSSKPIDYPVSCVPQAWASGAIFQLLKCFFNFQPDAPGKVLHIVDPALPNWLNRIRLRGLRVGDARLDLTFNRDGDSTYCQILKKQGDIRVVIET